ncbi:plasmid pRiA4b ORF-3 family protein [Rhodococcus sp. ACPA4]|nr:plasmid pRiA4b ORF-3 family protein [Rhodococcus sp. ACPA4]
MRNQRRRPEVANFVLRIELDCVSPPIWRRFSVPSNIELDQLHSIVQAVMGWGDQHAHQWVSVHHSTSNGPDRYIAREVIQYDGYQEDEFGEDEVRIDEAVTAVGEYVRYEYNVRAKWSHTLFLEQIVEDQPISAPSCLDGARACPPEDSGGPVGYLEFLNAQVSTGLFDPERFVLTESNAAVTTSVALHRSPPVGSSLFEKFLRRLSVHSAPKLFAAVAKAELSGGYDNYFETMCEGATRQLLWLLNSARGGGIVLTASGSLPPDLGASARDELDWDSEWTDAAGGSDSQLAVLVEVAKTLRLVRKLRGTLILTRLGASVIAYEGELWRHIVMAMPLGKGELAQEAGRILFLTLAAGLSESERSEVMIEGLTALGWSTTDGTLLGDDDWMWMVRGTLLYLRMIGAIVSNPLDQHVSADPEWGRRFARMVLSK